MQNENKPHKAHLRVTVSAKVKDYGNDPFFVKKANESKEFLEKHGLPKAFHKQSGN